MTVSEYEKLAETLEGLAAKATPGPWYTLDPPWLPRGAETSILAGSADPHVATHIADFEFPMMDRDEGDRVSQNPDADAALIVALVNALPAITAALRDAGRMREALADIAASDYGNLSLNEQYALWRRNVNAARAALARKAMEE